MYRIYLLISEDKNRSYVGHTGNIDARFAMHRRGGVRYTRNFGDFKYYILENIRTIDEAIKREKYWKSHAGRKRLKKYF